MRYSSVEVKRSLIIVNDQILNLNKLTKMFIVKYGYRE